MTSGLAAAAAAAAMMLGGSAASAAIMIATYTGTVSSGVDKIGMFGSSLAGEQFKAVFKYDTDGGVSDITPTGAHAYGPGVMLDAYLEINGLISHVPTGYYGSVQQSTADVQHLSIYDDGAFQTYFYIGLFGVSPPLDLTDAYTRSSGETSARWAKYNYSTGQYDVELNLSSPTTLAVTTAAVPEPATWAMMILGFGLAGVGIRDSRRRRGVALA
ncbi:PEPxxWA-CTERM sorting domain-containing protein [Phenylobacterium sp. Root700]|uniref:PEPxxWA-CTERM sorting domain-containing protein n=1 Tax=Phenylobacterium sp. Root700 TaxID=1736591 RepID=UPI00138F7E2F|nr:PEPxxWA-CTERM sorting domain-containing protein [Phenylobacterium sp. Root700]